MLDLGALLKQTRRIAVVGLSDNPSRDSYHVARYLLEAGYTLYPVNPALTEVLGQKAYAKLSELPETVDMVNVFRRSEAVPEIVREAIDHGAQSLWLQLGVGHADAEAEARAAGLEVVSNRCIMVDHARLLRP
ncbi:MAG: CoA-binding protein [Candidatus Sericytochromatia bacterium]